MSRILLIEDDPDTRFVMEHVLLDEGHQVETADSFGSGFALLTHNEFDLLVCDVRLPDGNGTELARHGQVKGIPAVIVTGYAFNLRGEEGFDIEEHYLLLKPVRAQELIAATDRALRGG